MGLHILGSKTMFFVGGVVVGQLYKAGVINKLANKALDGVESAFKSGPIQKIRAADEGSKSKKSK